MDLKKIRLSKWKIVIAIVLIVISVRFIIAALMVGGTAVADSIKPHEETTGIENYDKSQIVKDNYADMDSVFLIFPDSLSKVTKGDFISNIKSDMISSYGYIILEACYEEADFSEEVERISGISYNLKDVWRGKEEHKIQEIKYDDTMYNYPAYITSDGYCGGYEYALVDKENNRIIYIHLSYSSLGELQNYSDYLKVDKESYKRLEKTSKDNFTIYAYKFREGSTTECSY